MKKIVSVVSALLAATMCFSACSSGGEVTSQAQSAPSSPSESKQEVPKAQSSDKIVLKVGLQNPEQHPLCQGVKEFGRILEEKSGGRISLEIYYGGQLGDKATHLQSLQTGVLDMTMIMSGVLVDYGATDLKVFTLPYLFDSVEHARAVEASDVGQNLLDSIQASGTKMVSIGVYQESARNYFFKDKRVTKISDLKGLKIRSQEGSIYLETMEAFGSSPVSISFSELYSALQTGIVDGAEQPLSGFASNQYQEVCKYYLMDKHEISPNIVLMSELTWKNLSPDDQVLIKQAFNESIPYFNKLSDEKDNEIIETLKNDNVEILEPENPQEWKDAVNGIYEKYASDYKDVIEQIRNTPY